MRFFCFCFLLFLNLFLLFFTVLLLLLVVGGLFGSKVLDVVVGNDESFNTLTSELAPDRRDRDVEMAESEGRRETELKGRSH